MASVTEEVHAIAGVENVAVALDSGLVTITSTEPIDPTSVKAAVEEAGYHLT